MSLNTFTAQEAGIYSKVERITFWNYVFSQRILRLHWNFSVKAISYHFWANSEKHSTDFYSTPGRSLCNPYNVLQVGQQYDLPNAAHLFAHDRFADVLFAVFCFPCYILTHCRIYFSTFLLLQHFFTFLLKICKYRYIKNRFHDYKTKLSSVAHGFCNYTTSKIVNDPHDAEREKRQQEKSQRLDDPPD